MKFDQFAKLHVKGSPVLLYNAWDAGSARAIVKAGAKAIATSSWAVAAAQGFADGEDAPLDLVLQIAKRVAGAVDVPVTMDFEGGYAEDEKGLATNIARVLDAGVVGINFEDRVVRGEGLYAVDRQASRIRAIRNAAGASFFINARTDLFLGRGTPNPADSVNAAIERGAAYAAAGASSFFVPGLIDEALIAKICENVSLPVNIMMMNGAPTPKRLGELGVARISWGASPYRDAMAALEQTAKAIYG